MLRFRIRESSISGERLFSLICFPRISGACSVRVEHDEGRLLAFAAASWGSDIRARSILSRAFVLSLTVVPGGFRR